MRYSIIVPAYNAEKNIKRCLDSLCNQTYTNMEIIVIDDGSADNTYNLAMEYRDKYSNVFVYTQHNQGVIKARKNGVEKATGEYCTFVDADDWIDKNTIEEVNKKIAKIGGGNVDVIKFGYIREPYHTKKILESNHLDVILNKKELDDLHRGLLLSANYNHVCGQVFRKTLYDFVDLSKYQRADYGEDILVNLDVLGRSSRVILLSDCFYHYYRNPDSLTSKITLEIVADSIKSNILVNKKRIEYLDLFHVSGVNVRDIKTRSAVYASSQIKRYIFYSDCIDLKKMQDLVKDTGVYEFIGKPDFAKVSIKKYAAFLCLMKNKYGLLLFLRPFARLKLLAEKMFRRGCAH